MADLIDIEIGDQRIRVPAWATETTLEAMLKYNEITARALNKLVGVGSNGNKTVRVQEHYFKQIVDELQKSKKKQEELVKQNTTIIKAEKTKPVVARSKSQNVDRSSTDFNKKMSELSKNYSTSITLVEGSLLYLSKSLIDLNLVIKEISTTYKTMLKNTNRISKVFASGSGNGSGEEGSTTRSTGRSGRKSTSGSDPDIFSTERRDLNFKSLFQSFVEDLIEKQEKSIPITFDNAHYQKGVNNLKKAIDAGNTKGLQKEYLKSLKDALAKVSEGQSPDVNTIEELKSALKDFSMFNREYSSVTERLMKHYLNIDKTLSPAEKQNKKSYENFKDIEKLVNNSKQAAIGLSSLTGSAMTAGLTFGKITDAISKVAGAIPIVGGIAAAIVGVGGAVLEEYVNGLKNLSGVSAGLGSDLLQLNKFAVDAGMNLADFSKLISENGKAVKSLGNSTTSGMKKFSELSDDLLDKAKVFNNFGLTNNEYNEILMQEIELRRKSGMDSADIYDAVSSSMNGLLYNTSQLAAMTGQDAREMRRKMNESRKNDSTLNLAIKLLSENSTVAAANVDSFMGTMQRGGDSAIEIGNQMLRSAQFGEDFSIVLKNLPEELRAAVVQDIGSFEKVFDFMSDNVKSMPTEEFNAKLLSMIAIFSDKNLTEEMGFKSNIGILGIEKLVEMSSNFAGLNKSVEENIEGQAAAGAALKDAAWLAIPSELQNTANAIKENILVGVLNQLGIDTNDAGESFVEGLRKFVTNIEKNGLLKTTTGLAVNEGKDFITEHPIISSIAGLFLLKKLGVGSMLRTIPKLMGFKPGPGVPSAAARNMMGFATGAATGAATAGGNLVDDAARAAAAATTTAGGNLVDDAARAAAAATTTAGGNLVDDAARAAAAATTTAGGNLVDDAARAAANTGGAGGAIKSIAGRLAVPLTVGIGAYEAYDALTDETLTTRQKSEGVGSAVGGVGGALTGAGYGALYGGSIGSAVPIVGTAAGAFLGGVIGGALGYFGGSAVGGVGGDLVGSAITDNSSTNIPPIKPNNNSNLPNSSSQNSESMILLMTETNRLLGTLIRKYDEAAQ